MQRNDIKSTDPCNNQSLSCKFPASTCNAGAVPSYWFVLEPLAESGPLDNRSIEVTCSEASAIHSELEAAVEALRSRPIESPMGIVVTRVGPGHFMLSLSPEVPYGMTLEREG